MLYFKPNKLFIKILFLSLVTENWKLRMLVDTLIFKHFCNVWCLEICLSSIVYIFFQTKFLKWYSLKIWILKYITTIKLSNTQLNTKVQKKESVFWPNCAKLGSNFDTLKNSNKFELMNFQIFPSVIVLSRNVYIFIILLKC